MKMRTTTAVAFAALLVLLLLVTRAHGMPASTHICMHASMAVSPSLVLACCEVYPSAWPGLHTDLAMRNPSLSLFLSKQESGWTGSYTKQSTARSVVHIYIRTSVYK
jgi:hypothetical protein